MKNKKMIIIIAAAILVCVIGLIVGIIILKSNDKNENQNIQPENENSPEILEENFDTIFTNTTEGNNSDEVVFTKYNIQKEKNGEYDINIHIPVIKLEAKNAKKINADIMHIFAGKIKNIVKENTTYTIFNIDYAAYVNDNILSIVIKAILKEGTNPQRTIIQTYNYDLDQDKIVLLDDILESKKLEKESVQSRILEKVTEAASKDSEVSNQFIEQGYNVFVRDLDSKQYKLENIKTYFLGKDGHLYIVYAYGNNSFTNIKDIIVF